MVSESNWKCPVEKRVPKNSEETVVFGSIRQYQDGEGVPDTADSLSSSIMILEGDFASVVLDGKRLNGCQYNVRLPPFKVAGNYAWQDDKTLVIWRIARRPARRRFMGHPALERGSRR